MDPRVQRALAAYDASFRNKLVSDEDDSDLFMSVAKAHIKKALGKDIYAKEYSTMSPSEVLSARMTKASYINLTEGSHAAQAYANAHIPGFKLDQSLTTEHQSVFYNRQTGELRLAYRGTQAGIGGERLENQLANGSRCHAVCITGERLREEHAAGRCQVWHRREIAI